MFDDYFDEEEQSLTKLWGITTKENAIEEEKERFKIKDTGSLHWVFRKLKQLEETEEQTKVSYEYELNRLKEWKKKEDEKSENQRLFFEGLLLEYLMEERQKNPDFKIRTPMGSANLRKQQDQYEYDESAFLEWAKENDPSYIRVKESIDKSAVRKNFVPDSSELIHPETGEIVPGVRLVKRPDKLQVKLTKK